MVVRAIYKQASSYLLIVINIIPWAKDNSFMSLEFDMYGIEVLSHSIRCVKYFHGLLALCINLALISTVVCLVAQNTQTDSKTQRPITRFKTTTQLNG